MTGFGSARTGHTSSAQIMVSQVQGGQPGQEGQTGGVEHGAASQQQPTLAQADTQPGQQQTAGKQMDNTPAKPSTTAPAITSTDSSRLPWAFIDCPTDTLILLIAHMLNLLIQHNDQVVLTPDALTRFHSRAAPGISVLEYLRRIVKYTNMEVSCCAISKIRGEGRCEPLGQQAAAPRDGCLARPVALHATDPLVNFH